MFHSLCNVFLAKVSVGFNSVKVNRSQQILHSAVFIIKKNFILSSNPIKNSHFLDFSIIVSTYIEVKARILSNINIQILKNYINIKISGNQILKILLQQGTEVTRNTILKSQQYLKFGRNWTNMDPDHKTSSKLRYLCRRKKTQLRTNCIMEN